MFDFHEKRKIRRVVYSKPVLFVLVLLTVWIGTSVYERFGMEREMAHKLEARERELEVLKLRAATLESEVGHMQNERGIEEELRSRFDVVKDGEQVVIILDEKEKLQRGTTTRDRESEEKEWTFTEMMKGWFN